MASRRPDVTRTDEPGLVIIQLDGLSHDVMSHSVRAGRVPTSPAGSARAPTSWATGRRCCPRRRRPARRASSTATTTASPTSAGGRRRRAGSWWPTTPRTPPRSSAHLERRGPPQSRRRQHQQHLHRRRRPRLPGHVHDQGQGAWPGPERAFAWFFVCPYNYMLMGAKYLAEVVKERVQSWRQRAPASCPTCTAASPTPSCARPPTWPCAPWAPRSSSRRCTAAPRSSTWTTPTTTRSPTTAGPSARVARRARRRRPRAARRSRRRPRTPPRPYRFVILADHGQSLGQTFLQRYGVTLQDVVRSLMGGQASVAAATARVEDWGQLNTFLGEVSADRRA